jgi:fused signal recognition particle receptor
MSFFKKLKNKLFRSSSKIDEGLDAIVNDGGEEEVVETDDQAIAEAEQAEAEAAKQRANEATRLAEEAARVAEETRLKQEADAARLAEEARLQQEAEVARAKAEQEAQEREAQHLAEEAAAKEREALRLKAEDEARAREAERQRIEAEAEAERQRVAEQARLDAAAAKEAADAQEREAELARQAAAAQAQADEAARLAAEAEQREAERLRDEALAAEREEERQREVAAAAAREAEREGAEQAERLREEEMRAAEAERATEAARAEEERLRIEAVRPAPQAVMEPMTTLSASPLDEAEAEEPEQKKGIIGRLFGGSQKKTVVRRTLDDDMLEQLEELLITADMGVDTALRVTANMAEGRIGKKLSVAEIKELLANEITRIMEGVARPMPLYAHKPQVVLVVGVNGSGKTTTIGKLASQFKAAGKSVVIAAGDTFRAAAVEQLQVWGDRAGVPVLTAPEGSDPASLAFDAMEQAHKDGADLLMIDTAGRLQNRADLMEELSKIVRVIRKKDPDAPHNTLLVLDATTGQNALNQVKVFQELADVSGLVMTKLDGTAKGGVLVALADKFGLPIHAIGVGEQIDDLAPFDPEEFAKALVGLE